MGQQNHEPEPTVPLSADQVGPTSPPGPSYGPYERWPGATQSDSTSTEPPGEPRVPNPTHPYAPNPYAAHPYELSPYAPNSPVPNHYPAGSYPASNPYPGYPAVDPRQQAYQMQLYAAQKSRVAVGLLAILLGPLGIHNFYLGRVGIGLLQLLLTVLSAGFLAPFVWIWTIIEGILILTRSPSFATDRRGIPLRD